MLILVKTPRKIQVEKILILEIFNQIMPYEQLDYINGIGVLTYSITDSNNESLPEYYSVINPPLVEYSDENPFTAYGWLLGRY